MKTKDFIAFIQEFYGNGIEIVKAKNKGYAGDDQPFKNFEYATLVNVSVPRAILVRISDKLARISNILDNPERNVLKDESLQDSIMDAANYLAILAAYIESKKNIKATTPIAKK